MTYIFQFFARVSIVLIGACFVTFILIWFAPGDPALTIALARYDAVVPEEIIEQIRIESGLDAGFWHAFVHWLTPLLQGDLGNSSVSGRPIWPDLKNAALLTAPLALLGLGIGLMIAIPLAVLATRFPGSWIDRGAMALASIGAAMPAYWLALLLILAFSVKLLWLPAMGAGSIQHLVLPALTLGLGTSASLTRILRSALLEARDAPFLPALTRRGVSSKERALSHIAPHAAIPVLTVLSLEFAFLLEGTVMVEVIFARPGLGGFLVSAIGARDIPKVQAIVLLTAVFFVTINLVTDLLYRFVDPRIGDNDV